MFARKYVGKDLTTQSKSRVIKYKKIMCDIYNKLIKLKVSIYIEKKQLKWTTFLVKLQRYIITNTSVHLI